MGEKMTTTEEMVIAAYKRGFQWGRENVGMDSYLDKAAYDYADATLSASPVPPSVPPSPRDEAWATPESMKDYWRAVIGPSYKPIKYSKHGCWHPTNVKAEFEAHKHEPVADVIAGLIFSLTLALNREELAWSETKTLRDQLAEKSTSPRDEVVEALRQSLRQWKMYAEFEEDRDLSTEQSPEADLFRIARAALLAIEASGHAVVPMEPTQEMIRAGGPHATSPSCYDAMLSARPRVT